MDIRCVWVLFSVVLCRVGGCVALLAAGACIIQLLMRSGGHFWGGCFDHHNVGQMAYYLKPKLLSQL